MSDDKHLDRLRGMAERQFYLLHNLHYSDCAAIEWAVAEIERLRGLVGQTTAAMLKVKPYSDCTAEERGRVVCYAVSLEPEIHPTWNESMMALFESDKAASSWHNVLDILSEEDGDGVEAVLIGCGWYYYEDHPGLGPLWAVVEVVSE